MPQAQRSIHIERPVEEVFGFLSNPVNDHRWRSQVKEIQAEGLIDVGTLVHQRVAGPAGRAIPADYRVTAYQVPTRFAFKVVAGPVRPEGDFRFTRSGDGTDVSFSLQARLTGVKKLLMSKPVQQAMDGEVAALERVKAILESEGQGQG